MSPRSSSDGDCSDGGRTVPPAGERVVKMASSQKRPAPEEDDDDASERGRIPLALRPWIASYRSVPRARVPFTSLEISFTIVSCFVLIVARLIIEAALPHFGWPPGNHKITIDAAASMLSGFQATFLVSGLAACLLSQPYRPAGRMSDHPRWWQDGANALIEFCTGYMAYDVVFLLAHPWMKGESVPGGEWVYIGHHFATSYMMTGVRLMGAGHLSAMYLMFVGEATSPLMNAHFVLRLAVRLKCCNGPVVHELLAYVEYSFAVLYCLFRVALGPLGAAHLSYRLLFTEEGRRNVNVWVALTWMPMVWGVIFGSKAFIEEAMEMIADGVGVVKYGPDYDLGEMYRYHDEL